MAYRNPKQLYHGTRIDLLSIEVDHPKKGVIQREVVAHPGAVAILPILADGRVVLIRNERYVVQEQLWEIPAGTLEPDEAPELCATRELQEETGYQAASITHLLDFYTTPGFCNEMIHLYLATDLTFVGQNLDETEQIEVFSKSWEEISQMIQNKTIRDAKTLLALLFFQQRNTQ